MTCDNWLVILLFNHRKSQMRVVRSIMLAILEQVKHHYTSYLPVQDLFPFFFKVWCRLGSVTHLFLATQCWRRFSMLDWLQKAAVVVVLQTSGYSFPDFPPSNGTVVHRISMVVDCCVASRRTAHIYALPYSRRCNRGAPIVEIISRIISTPKTGNVRPKPKFPFLCLFSGKFG